MFEFFQNVFQQIGDFLSKVWEVFLFLVDELTQFFQIIKPAISFFQTLFNSLPPLFIGFGIAMLAVLIIYLILGRNAGGD